MEKPNPSEDQVKTNVESKLRQSDQMFDALFQTIQLFTLQWKDHGSNFQSAKEDLLEMEEEMAEARKKLQVKEIEVEKGLKMVQGFLREKRDKEEQLGLLRSELAGKEKELGSLHNRVEARTAELEGKERELGFVNRRLCEIREEISCEEANLGLVNKYLEETRKELKCKQTEADNKVKELIKNREKEELRLAMVEEKRRVCAAELDLKRKQLDSVKASIEGCDNELRLKKEVLETTSTLANKVMGGYDEQLKEKEKEYNEATKSVKEKEKELELLEESIRKCESNNFHSQDKAYSVELRSKTNSLELLKKEVEASVENLKRNRAELSAIQASIDVASKEMKMLQCEIEKHQKELEEIEMHKLSMQEHAHSPESNDKGSGTAENLAGSCIPSPIVTVDLSGSPIHPSSEGFIATPTSYEGSRPQVLPDEPQPFEKSSDILTTALRSSKDPAKMVISVIRSRRVQQGNDNTKPYDRNVPNNLVQLLQQLVSQSPVVSPLVKEAAKDLAVTWKGSLSQDTMDILAFLLFLATYGVASHFGEDEVLQLAEKITRHEKAPGLWSDLGLTAKVPGLIKSLIEKRMYFEAARFSCAFQLVDEYQPHLFLLKLLEESGTFKRGTLLLEAQCEAFNKHLDLLQQLIQRGQELNFDHSVVNSKLRKHVRDLCSKLSEQKKKCKLVAGPIKTQRQGGLSQHGQDRATNTNPNYRMDPTGHAMQQRNWRWQGGSLTHKRPRTGKQ